MPVLWNRTKQYLQHANLFYYAALYLWLSFDFLRTTCFYKLWGLKGYLEIVLYVVIFLTALDFACSQKKETEDCLIHIACSLFAILAYKRVSFLFAVSLLLLYPARRISFQNLAKGLLAFYSAMVCLTILGMTTGVIEDILFYENLGTRVRHSLGFTYCSYSSHYVLTITMLYLVVRKSIRLWESAPLLFLNYVVYLFTDTKTDLMLCVCLLFGALVFGNREKQYQAKKWHVVIAAVTPFVFLCVSRLAVLERFGNVEKWIRINLFLNGRLALGQKAVSQYGVHLFGKKIKWIGVGQFTNNPDLTYNYVDNIFLQTLLSMGIIFTFFMCLMLGRSLAGSLRQGYTMRAVVLFVFLVHGLLDPQLRSLCYNPFLLLLFSPECNCFGTVTTTGAQENAEEREKEDYARENDGSVKGEG